MKKKFLIALGLRVEKLRTKKKLSMNKLAISIGKDYHSILRLEQGKANPSYIYLCEVAEGLGITIDQLIKGLP